MPRRSTCHLHWLGGDSQLNPPRGRNSGGASSLSSDIEPDGLTRRKRDRTSRPELCVGPRTADGKRGSMSDLEAPQKRKRVISNFFSYFYHQNNRNKCVPFTAQRHRNSGRSEAVSYIPKIMFTHGGGQGTGGRGAGEPPDPY